MANVALIPELAKLLLAIAWADGELHAEEETTLKEVIGLLPPPSVQEWAVIELYLLTPISPDERAQLLQNIQALIRSAADKQIALDAVDAMVHADGDIDPNEAAVARSIRAAIAAVDVSVLGLLRRAIARTTSPNREQFLALWQTNPVLYMLYARSGNETLLSDNDVQIAALAAGIMAQVVRVTPATAAQEQPVLAHALRSDWRMPPDKAEQLADAALGIVARNVDFHRIARELARRSSETQRTALLDTLFAVANAADNVSPREIDEIRVITDRLNLTQAQFIAAKLKIPAAERGGL
jgi:uncharacterized tellurite resistance protein B-like protein